jgi:hypothetical protein
MFYTVIASLICFCYACQKDEQPDVVSAKKLQKKNWKIVESYATWIE